MLLHLALRCEVVWCGEKVLQISLVVVIIAIGLHFKKRRISFHTRRDSNERQSSGRLSNVNLLSIVSPKNSLPKHTSLSPSPSPFLATHQENITNKSPTTFRGPPLCKPSLGYEDFILFPPTTTPHHNEPRDISNEFCSCHLSPQQRRPLAPLIPITTNETNPLSHSTLQTLDSIVSLPTSSHMSSSETAPGQCHCLPPSLLNIGSHLLLTPFESESYDFDLDPDLEVSNIKAVSIDSYISRRALSSLSAEGDVWGFMR